MLLNSQIELTSGSDQQVFRKVLQCLQLRIADVGPVVLLKPEYKKPTAAFVSRYQRTGTATLAELQARIATVLAYINGLNPEQFADAATREIITQAGTPREKRFDGQTYLLHYGLPHFFFHVTTAYDLLRHNGVELSKKDYIGTY